MTGEQEPESAAYDAATELIAACSVRGLEARTGTFLVPETYEIDSDGVYKQTLGREGEKVRVRVTYAPLVPVRIYESFEGDQWVELGWDDRGRKVFQTVPRSVAKSGRKLVAALGDKNIPVIDSDARQVERWLAAAESANRRSIERVQVTRQLGWQPDGKFVTSSGEPYRIEPRFPEQVPALDAHRPCGTIEDWKQTVKLVEPYPAAQMGLYAGLAAPLLVPLGLDSGTLDISGRSSRGKSTAAKLGLSPWACPSEKGGAIATWKTTLLALEKRLNIANGVPVVIDETQTVKYDGIVNDVLYLVPFNHGTQRGAGYPSALPWRTVVISTGERSALTYTVEEGASARVLCVTEPPFGTDGDASAKVVNRIREGLDANFGTAGPEFVERLADFLAETDGLERLRSRHSAATELHTTEGDLNRRRAPLVAALHLAGQLAFEFGVVPFAPPKIDVWHRIFSATDQADNRPEMALDVVRGYVAAHGDEFWTTTTSPLDRQPHRGWLGRRDQDGDATKVAIFPERLRGILADARYELDAVLPGWLEAGVLALQPSQRPAHLVKRNIAGMQARVYEFLPHAFLNSDGD